MKRVWSLPIALFLVIATGSFVAAQVAGNRVVATVNDTAITEREVLEAARPQLDALDPTLPSAERAETRAAIMRETLSLMINNLLLRAKGRKILKERPDLEAHLKNRIAEYLEEERSRAGGETAFRERLHREGVSHADYVEELKQVQLRELPLQHFVYSGNSVSRDEILDYYETRRDSLTDPAQVKFRRLFLKGPAHGDARETRRLAEDIMAQLREGTEFQTLVRRHSDGPRAADGGLWDFEPPGRRPEPIESILFETPVGEIGGPVETGGDITFVQVLERKPGRRPSFEEAEPIIRERLETKKRNARYLDFIARLEQENFVEYRPTQ